MDQAAIFGTQERLEWHLESTLTTLDKLNCVLQTK